MLFPFFEVGCCGTFLHVGLATLHLRNAHLAYLAVGESWKTIVCGSALETFDEIAAHVLCPQIHEDVAYITAGRSFDRQIQEVDRISEPVPPQLLTQASAGI